MDERLLRIFRAEIAHQCRFVALGAEQLEQVRVKDEKQRRRYAQISADLHAKIKAAQGESDTEEMLRLLDRLNEADDEQDPPRVFITGTWFALQTILTAAANISKLLWGKDDDSARERQALRESLNVDDTSCLKPRRVRNMFEHIDEYIIEWYEKQGGSYVGRNIGSGAVHPPGQTPHQRQFGNYDPDTGIVTFWTRPVSIPEIIAEAARIGAIADPFRV